VSLRRNSTPLFHPNRVDNFNLKCTLHDNSVANSISNDIVIGGTFQIEWLSRYDIFPERGWKSLELHPICLPLGLSVSVSYRPSSVGIFGMVLVLSGVD